MWEPGHWKASGLQVLDSWKVKQLYNITHTVKCLQWAWVASTLASASNMSLTAFLVLIRAIATVIRAVTHPVGGNTAVVPTFKLGGCTKFVCKGGQRELSILEK